MDRDKLCELTEFEAIEKELCERSLLYFISVFWSVIDGSPFKSGWHLEAICAHLEALNRCEIRNLVINGPPRSSKSMPASVFFQPWDWIKSPYRTWLTGAVTQRLAVQFNHQSRLIIRSEKFQRYWGDRFSMSLDNDLKTEFSNDLGGRRLVVGLKTRFIGAGGERKVIDDPHMPNDSPQAMLEVGELFFGTWRSRTNNPKTATELLIMQRLSPYDLTEQIKAHEGKLWEFLVLPSRFDPSKRFWTSLGWTDPRTEEGELLWPEQVDDKAERTLRKSLKERADAQMDQNPKKDEESIYKDKNLRNFYTRLEINEESDICITTADTGVKSNNAADFSACVFMVKKGQRKFHVEGFAKKLEIGGLVKEYTGLLSRWVNRGIRFRRHLIEDSANGPALFAIAGRRFSRLKLVKAFKNKMLRFKSVVPEYEDNKVWYPAPGAIIVFRGEEYPIDTDYTEEWIKQTRSVGTTSKDDCPDASAQGLIYYQDLEEGTEADLDEEDLFDETEDDGFESAYIFFPGG